MNRHDPKLRGNEKLNEMIDEQITLHKELEEDHVNAFMNKWMKKDPKQVGE